MANFEVKRGLTICVQIGQVKEKIGSEKGWEAASQKLIYAGQ